jgi:hypothetical protein
MTTPTVNPDGSAAGGGSSLVRRPRDSGLVGSIQDRWRDDFDENLDEWDVTVGDGMSVTLANSTLSIAGGTVPNSVTTLLSKRMFSPATRAMIGAAVATKQANQQVVVDFVSVDRYGNPDDRNIQGWRWWATDSATTTVAAVLFSNGASAITAASSGTLAAAVTSSQVYEMELAPDECWWHNRAINSAVARTISLVRHDNVPNPERVYKLRIRVINLGTAPTANTHNFSFVSVLDYSEMTAEITASRGGGSAGQAMPVTQIGTVTVSPGASPLPTGSTTGVVATHKIISAATTNGALLITADMRLDGYQFTNLGATARFVKFYNKATAPTVGTDVPVITIALPPGGTVTTPPGGIASVRFSLGLGIAITGAAADADTTAIGAGEVIGTVYRHAA